MGDAGPDRDPAQGADAEGGTGATADADADVPPSPDPAALLDRLIASGAVVEHEDGTLTTGDDYESTRAVYHDSYADVDDATFRDTLASAFGVDRETAAERVARDDVTRAHLVDYLALSSYLDDPPADPTLARMADLLVEVGPSSPVPDAVREVADPLTALRDADAGPEGGDGPDEEADADASGGAPATAAVTVWRRHCVPCERLKERLDEVLAVLDGVAVLGVDGERESARAFRRRFDVDAAPAVVVVRGDESVTLTGRIAPDDVADALVAVGAGARIGTGMEGEAESGGGSDADADADADGGTDANADADEDATRVD